MTPAIIPAFEPGDLLGYADPSFVDFNIELFTAGPLAHVEIYVGHGLSFASRNGIGVNLYPMRQDGLSALLRPNKELLDFDSAAAWVETVRGESYDFWGLLSAAIPGIVEQPKHLFCSAAATLWYRNATWDAAHPECPAVKITPVDFLKFAGFQHLLSPPGW